MNKRGGYGTRCTGTTDGIADTIATSLVLSKLDYCNCLLLNFPSTQTNRLQLVLDSATSAVTKTPKFHHITPILKSLHFLKINERIQYKVLSLTYKTLNSSRPAYLHSLVTVNHTGSTRSSSLVTFKSSFKSFSSSNHQEIFLSYSYWLVEPPTLWISSVGAIIFYISPCHLSNSVSQKTKNSSLSFFFSTLVSTWPRLHLDGYPRCWLTLAYCITATFCFFLTLYEVWE